MNELKDSVTGLASISFVGKLLGRISEYGLTAVIAIHLGASDLGQFTVLLVVLRIGSMFSRVGLDTAAQRFVPMYRDDTKVLNSFLTMCLVGPFVAGTVISIVLYVALHSTLGSFVDLQEGTAVIVFAMPFFSLVYVLRGIAQGFKDVEGAVLVVEIGLSFGSFALVTVSVLLWDSLVNAILAYLFAVVLAAVFGVLWLTRSLPEFRVQFSTAKAGTFLSYSAQAGVEKVFDYLVLWLDVLVLSLFVTTTEIGTYQVAFQTAILITFAISSANAIFPSVISTLYESGNTERIERLYRGVTKWGLLLSTLAAAFLLVFSETILSFFGTAFQQGQTPFVILVVAQLLATTSGPSGYLLLMTGFERVQAANAVFATVLNLTLNLSLVPQYGIVGAALASGTTIAVLNFARLVQIRHFLGIWPYSVGSLRLVPVLGAGVTILLAGRLVADSLPAAVTVGCFAGVVTVLLGASTSTAADRELVEAVRGE